MLVDLPIGTRVRDWRHLGRDALKQALKFIEPDEEDAPRPYLLLEWSPELWSDIQHKVQKK
ncbi:MAG: hypothetical protein C4337_00865 [Armatimonadota bacterium]